MDIYEKCKNCKIRIGSHSIPESVRCKLINEDQLNDITLKHTDIWEMLNNKWISKEKAITLFHNLNI
jgi:hypothetical protein